MPGTSVRLMNLAVVGSSCGARYAVSAVHGSGRETRVVRFRMILVVTFAVCFECVGMHVAKVLHVGM